MKRILIGLLALATQVGAGGLGQGCGQVEVGGELLFWRPTMCGLDFCITDSRSFPGTNAAASVAQRERLPVGQANGVVHDLDLGYRLRIGYIADDWCRDATIQYTGLRAKEDAVCHPEPQTGGLWPTFGHPHYLSNAFFNPVDLGQLAFQLPAVFHARSKLDYDAIELQAGSRSMKGCRMMARGFVGLQWANLEHRFRVRYAGTVNPGVVLADANGARAYTVTVVDRRCVWGLGPKVGSEMRYEIGCDFGVTARFGLSLIAGSLDGRYQQSALVRLATDNSTVFDQQGDVTYCNRLQVIPEVDMRMGINYRYCRGCLVFEAEVGYEMTSYFNAIGQPSFDDTGAIDEATLIQAPGNGMQTNNCYNVNLDGVYVMGKLIF